MMFYLELLLTKYQALIDNRDNSEDSRMIGLIGHTPVIGVKLN